MGFGSAQGMRVAIKNNRDLLSKRKDRKKEYGSYKNKKTEYNLPKATPQKLRKIKLRMQRENRQRRVKHIVVLGFTLLGIISA